MSVTRDSGSDELLPNKLSREPVLLNVYDMYKINEFTSNIGLGVFHSGMWIINFQTIIRRFFHLVVISQLLIRSNTQLLIQHLGPFLNSTLVKPIHFSHKHVWTLVWNHHVTGKGG